MIIQLAAGTVAIPLPEHRVDGAVVWQFTPTASQSLTFAPDGLPGQLYVLKLVTAGTSSYTTTFSTGFLASATLASGTTDAKTFTVTFISDGQRLTELSRTAAM